MRFSMGNTRFYYCCFSANVASIFFFFFINDKDFCEECKLQHLFILEYVVISTRKMNIIKS